MGCEIVGEKTVWEGHNTEPWKKSGSGWATIHYITPPKKKALRPSTKLDGQNGQIRLFNKSRGKKGKADKKNFSLNQKFLSHLKNRIYDRVSTIRQYYSEKTLLGHVSAPYKANVWIVYCYCLVVLLLLFGIGSAFKADSAHHPCMIVKRQRAAGKKPEVKLILLFFWTANLSETFQLV